MEEDGYTTMKRWDASSFSLKLGKKRIHVLTRSFNARSESLSFSLPYTNYRRCGKRMSVLQNKDVTEEASKRGEQRALLSPDKS